MKIAVSTYSFNPLLLSGAITQFACIEKAVEMGFDAIEFVDILPHDGSSAEEYAKKLRAECEKHSLPISNYTFGADFLTDATTGFAAGSRGFRGFEEALPRLAEGCRAVTEYAAEKGIRTMVENHGLFCQDSCRVEKLINRVAHENFGLLCDMGNFLCVDEDPSLAYSRVAPYAFYAHAKDFHVKSGMEPNPGEGYWQSRGGNYLRGAIIGHGNVPVKQCLSILKNAGYNGTIAVEFEGLEDSFKGISIGLANLRRYTAEVYGE